MMIPLPKAKLLALPPLPIVLFLFLGAGLLPKNSMAVQCDKQLCTVDYYPQECPKKPDSKLEDCSGHCFQEVSKWDYDKLVKMDRRCASDKEATCLMKATGNCVRWGFYYGQHEGDDLRDRQEFRAYVDCLLDIKPKPAAKNKEEEEEEEELVPYIDVEETGLICACDKDNCNGDYTFKPPSKPKPPPPPPKPVKCYVADCAANPGSEKKVEDCLKAPETSTAKTCPDHYCFKKVEYELVDGKTVSIVVHRDCASYGEKTCLLKEPGACMKLRTDLNYEDRDKDREKLFEYEHKCMKNLPKPSVEGKSGGKKKGVETRHDYCVCDGELCNGWIALRAQGNSSESGVKHLSYNVVLVGALLLMSLSSLQSLFLVW